MLEKEETIERFKKDIKLLKKHELSPKQIHLLLSKTLREQSEDSKEEKEKYIDKYFILDLRQEIELIYIQQVEVDEEGKIKNLVGEKLKLSKNKTNFSLTKGKIALEVFKETNYKELTGYNLKYIRGLLVEKIENISQFIENIDEIWQR